MRMAIKQSFYITFGFRCSNHMEFQNNVTQINSEAITDILACLECCQVERFASHTLRTRKKADLGA